MNRIFACIVFLTIRYSCTYAQGTRMTRKEDYHESVPNPKELAQKLRIKKEIIYCCEFHRNRIIDSSIQEIREYDSSGNVMQKIVYSEPTSLLVSIESRYFYSPSGRLIKILEDYKMASRPPYTSIQEFDYDSTGNEVMNYTYNADTTTLTVIKKEYDAANRIIRTYQKYQQNDAYQTNQYYYSGTGQFLKRDSMNNKGEIIGMYSEEWDSAQHKKTEYVQNKMGRHTVKTLLYDPFHKIIECRWTEVTSFTYIRNHPTITESSTRIQKYIYNPDGSLAELSFYNDKAKEQVLHHHYKYY